MRLPRCQRLPQRTQCLQVFRDVLENIEHADQIEGFPERAVAHIALHQRPGRSLLGEA